MFHKEFLGTGFENKPEQALLLPPQGIICFFVNNPFLAKAPIKIGFFLHVQPLWRSKYRLYLSSSLNEEGFMIGTVFPLQQITISHSLHKLSKEKCHF
jgi:hypothetical protein